MGWESESDSVRPKRIPMLGTIAAGEPILAEGHCEYYVEANQDVNADFCIKVKGDSMINARILDGDFVFIRKQPDVEDGEIAAVMINGEATLKRVYKMPGRIQLRAENPRFEPIYVIEEDHSDVKILGKAVLFQSDVK
jgi:repressor LexA